MAFYVFQLIVIGSLLFVQIVKLYLLFVSIKSRGCKIVSCCQPSHFSCSSTTTVNYFLPTSLIDIMKILNLRCL
jgi:hypothetical protein